MTPGLVSVVIPVYNGAPWLDDIVASLQAQTYTQWEALFVDDSSTDDSYDILRRHALSDSRIRVFRKPNGRFACVGIAYALERALGEWFFYMSQDDLITPDLLEQAVGTARACGAQAVVPQMETWSRHDSATRLFEGHPAGTEVTPLEAFTETINWRMHTFALFSMELVRRVGVTCEFINSDEYDTRRFYYFSNRVRFCGGLFRYHIGNPEALTVKWSEAQIGLIRCDLKLHEFVLAEGFTTGPVCDESVRRVAAECLRCLKMLAKSPSAAPGDARALWKIIDDSRHVWDRPELNGRRLTHLLRHTLGRRLTLALIEKMR